MACQTKYRQRRTKSEAKVANFVNHFQTCISQAWNGLLRHFQCLKSSAGNCLAVEKGPRSIAPQGAELWPFKEGYRLLISAKLVKIAHLCSNTRFSGLEWSFAKIQKPKTLRMKCSCHGTGTQDSGTSGRQATAG